MSTAGSIKVQSPLLRAMQPHLYSHEPLRESATWVCNQDVRRSQAGVPAHFRHHKADSGRSHFSSECLCVTLGRYQRCKYNADLTVQLQGDCCL